MCIGGQISTKDKGTAASSHVKEKSKSTASCLVAVQKEDRVSTTVGRETETKGAKAAGKGQHGYNFLSSYVTIFKLYKLIAQKITPLLPWKPQHIIVSSVRELPRTQPLNIIFVTIELVVPPPRFGHVISNQAAYLFL